MNDTLMSQQVSAPAAGAAGHCWKQPRLSIAFIAHASVSAELASNLINPCQFRQVCSTKGLSPPLMQAQEFYLQKSESFQHLGSLTSVP